MDNYLLTEEEIDDIRLETMKEIGKDADRIWWDLCAAYEKMYGEDDAMEMEQFLINMINKTVEKALTFQLSKLLAAAPEVRGSLKMILISLSNGDIKYPEANNEIHNLYAGAILEAENRGYDHGYSVALEESLGGKESC